MPLSKLHVINVCKFGEDNECKYLEEDVIQPNVFNCLKLSSNRVTIDKIHEATKNKIGKNGVIAKSGDNCKGYPLLLHKIVGYDQKDS